MATRYEFTEAQAPVRELMSTALYTISDEESLLMAWELLERSGRHHLPVIRGDGRCAGVLERSDLAVACAEPGSALSRRRVCELMRGRRTAAVHADDPVRRAAAVMTETGADALPVTDARGRLLGLLTARDILAAVAGLPRRAGPGHPPPSPFPVLPGLPPPPVAAEPDAP